jgi:hypothetical protein
VRLRRASRSKTAGQGPLNRVVKFKRRPERRCVGRLPRFGLQYVLMPMRDCRLMRLESLTGTVGAKSGGQQFIQTPGDWPGTIGAIGDHGVRYVCLRVVHAPE